MNFSIFGKLKEKNNFCLTEINNLFESIYTIKKFIDFHFNVFFLFPNVSEKNIYYCGRNLSENMVETKLLLYVKYNIIQTSPYI